MQAARIALLDPALADQIAAGEVVERPASIVKELVDNAVDAGARRITVELTAGGIESIRVVDTGSGMHPGDLELAVRRHATSKIRTSSELLDIQTLGFRGEALASIAAVARLEIRSRRAEDEAGTRLVAQAGQTLETTVVGMPPGTEITVSQLFSSIPARRKFLRSEATEAAHCVEAVSRIALVHPEVHVRVRSGGRVVLDLPPSTPGERVSGVLERRGAGPYERVEGEEDGVRVQAYLAGPESATTRSGGTLIVVRGRVVNERNLQQIVTSVYGNTLERGRKPVACIFVEPPAGTVDVNVHPQKVEVRFADAQTVYGAVRRVFERAAVTFATAEPALDVGSRAGSALERGSAHGGVWAARDTARADRPSGTAYRLGTRALDRDYRDHKRGVDQHAELLARSRREPGAAASIQGGVAQPRPAPERRAPVHLTTLPPGVAVFRVRDELWAVDLQELRSHRVKSRLVAELAHGGVASQALLQPVSVSVGADDARLLCDGREALAELGLDLEGFGEDGVLVRGIPAVLSDCVEHEAVAGLLARLIPWLRMVGPKEQGLSALAGRSEIVPSARTATRWLEECLDDSGELVARTPGVFRFTGPDLCGA